MYDLLGSVNKKVFSFLIIMREFIKLLCDYGFLWRLHRPPLNLGPLLHPIHVPSLWLRGMECAKPTTIAPARSVAPYLLALWLRLRGMGIAKSIMTALFRSVAPYLLARRILLSGMEIAGFTTTGGCRGASLVVALVVGMAMVKSIMTVCLRSGTTLVVAVWFRAS